MKSIYNKCEVCGKPRGKGKYEFAHGRCYEQIAKAEITRSVTASGLDKLSYEDKRAARSHSNQKSYKKMIIPKSWLSR